MWGRWTLLEDLKCRHLLSLLQPLPCEPCIFGAVLLVLMRLQHGGIWQCASGEGLPWMGKDCRENSRRCGELGHFVVHSCLGHQGNSPVLPQFSYLVSSVDVKHAIYWTLISEFQINQIFNFLLGVCAKWLRIHSLPSFNTFRELYVNISFSSEWLLKETRGE